MRGIETVLFWLSVSVYALSTVSGAIAFSFKKPRFFDHGNVLMYLGFLLHTFTLVVRWLRLGHGPYLNTYEVWVSDAWVIMACFLVAVLLYPRIKGAGYAITPAALMLLGGAITHSQVNDYSPPTYGTFWLIVHISFAKLAFGSLFIASALAALYLLKYKSDDDGSLVLGRMGFLSKLPSSEVLDDLIYRFTLFGFFMLAVMIVAGSLWANKSWGRYWGWDSVETWSLLVWLIYGAYLHLRRTMGWRGNKAALFSLAAVSFVFISYFVIPYLPGTVHDLWVNVL